MNNGKFKSIKCLKKIINLASNLQENQKFLALLIYCPFLLHVLLKNRFQLTNNCTLR